MIKMINKLKNRKGFTLIELIVVLAVLAIIMAIAVPRFMGVQSNAAKKADAATKEMIEKAAILYYTTEKDSSFKISDLVAKGYLAEFNLQEDENNDTYAEAKDRTITVTENTSGQSVTIEWTK